MGDNNDQNYLQNLMDFSGSGWREQERRESLERQWKREAEAREARWKRDREAAEAFERARKAEADKKRKEIEAERKAIAEAQAKEDKERLRKEYLAVGGDCDFFDDFYEVEMPRILAERLRERERRIARPGRDY